MPSVLTENSTVTCAHQGTVQLRAGQSKLSVDGSKVLVDGDLTDCAISGCITVTDPNTSSKTCTSTTAAVGGVASKLKVNGKGVLLEDISGQTDGTVSGTLQTWSVQDAGQTKLKTV